jgi:c-di-GMP-binding flagellar brake protein YcgR
MFIDEIPINSNITIAFNYVTKSTKLETTVKRIGPSGKSNKCIITNAARVDNRIINPNSFRGNVTVRFLKKGAKRYDVWKQVRIKYDRSTKEYIIITPKASEKHERRQAVRIPIGIGATVQIEGDARRHNCTVYDISKTGIGVRMETLDYKAIGRGFLINFADQSEFTSFLINGRCVREVDGDSKVKTYGCTIRSSPELLAYVRKKQVKYENTVKASGRTKETSGIAE